MMLQVNQKESNGYTIYEFTANNTDYEVLTADGVEFIVYSSRIGLTGRTPPAVYDNLEAMSKRSKALSHLAVLIKS